MLDEMISLQKEYAKIHNNSGFITCDDDDILLETKYFLEKFNDYKVKRRNDFDYPFELFVEYKGVKFNTILTGSQMIRYSITLKEDD